MGKETTVKMKGIIERMRLGRSGPQVKMSATTERMKGTTGRMIETTGKMKEIIERRGPPAKMRETTVKMRGTIGRMKETTENIGKTERMRGIKETIGIIWSKHKDASTHFGNNLYTIMSAIRFSNVCNIFLLAQFSFSSSVDKQ